MGTGMTKGIRMTTAMCWPGWGGMRAKALLTVSQWLSPAFPVGAFAWSHGLEQAVRDGAVRDAGTLADWLDAMLTCGAGRTDAILLIEAARAEDVAEIAELAAALAPSRERLAETMGQGAAFAAMMRAVWGLDMPDMAYPVAVGRAVRLAGLPEVAVAQVFLQAVSSNLVQAAQRLMPLGQTGAQRVLMDLSPVCVRVAQEADKAGLDGIGGAGFAMDIASMRHERMEPRMFRS
jgi:urease accessory protein